MYVERHKKNVHSPIKVDDLVRLITVNYLIMNKLLNINSKLVRYSGLLYLGSWTSRQ